MTEVVADNEQEVEEQPIEQEAAEMKTKDDTDAGVTWNFSCAREVELAKKLRLEEKGELGVFNESM